MKGVIVNGICLDYDPQGSHREGGDNECNWWHGGVCDCRPEMVASLAVKQHCHECNFVSCYGGDTPCNCNGRCICAREEGCPCVSDGLDPPVQPVAS